MAIILTKIKYCFKMSNFYPSSISVNILARIFFLGFKFLMVKQFLKYDQLFNSNYQTLKCYFSSILLTWVNVTMSMD